MSSRKDNLEQRKKWNIHLLVHIFSQALDPLVMRYFPHEHCNGSEFHRFLLLKHDEILNSY